MKAITLLTLLASLVSCGSPKGIVQNKFDKAPSLEVALISVPNPNLFNPHPTFALGHVIGPARYYLKINGKVREVPKKQYDRATVGTYCQ